MKNTERLENIENNVGNVDPNHTELMQLYNKFEQSLDEGDRKAARKLREQADKWMKADGRFTELAYFPPEGAGIDHISWLKFVKFNFGNTNPKKADL